MRKIVYNANEYMMKGRVLVRLRQRSAVRDLVKQSLRPERVMCGGFLLMILIGGALLSLPVATVTGESIGMGRGLFTATSAVCVTGLVAVDTGTTFSFFGQIVLILLIQMGGLGFMVFATLVMVAAGHRISLRNRVLMRESLNTTTLSGVVRLTLWYGLLALCIETAGALVLAVRFVPTYGWIRGLYYSLWHAVSAFCNAGFDLFGQFSSLTAFQRDPLVLLTIAVLIILGGTGFAVISELMTERFRWKRMSLHTKLVLSMTGMLLLCGTVFMALLEWGNPKTLGAVEGTGHKLVNAFFQSATMRTAGFNSVDLSTMADGTKMVSILLMLTGANSASTGGGMKTTTVAVLLLAVISVIRGDQEVSVMGKRLPRGLVQRALAVVTVTVMVFLTGTLALTLVEGGRFPMIDLMFEAASAIATVGVTSVGTPEMNTGSHWVLAAMMYLGRVGPLTMALALQNRQETQRRVRYPEESVTIG